MAFISTGEALRRLLLRIDCRGTARALSRVKNFVGHASFYGVYILWSIQHPAGSSETIRRRRGVRNNHRRRCSRL
ncbi:Protein of unknown function [Gryllus bimaculatus]|nr:Protein of unknown function [Gryllus bimaculatus]